MEEYAHLAGETNHTQYIEFSGGESGSPGLLWDDAEHQANIRAFLDTGEIDVLIMICCSPEFIRTLDTDQAVWNFTDHAVMKNPDVRIGLAMPWKDFPGEYGTQASMTNSTLDILPYWENPDELRADHPVRTCSPSIMAHSHTRCEMFEAGDLDGDLERLQGPKATSLFTDQKGHAGDMLVDVGTLIWLHAVHGVIRCRCRRSRSGRRTSVRSPIGYWTPEARRWADGSHCGAGRRCGVRIVVERKAGPVKA